MSKARKKKDAAVGKQFKVGRCTVVVEDVLNEGGFAVIFLVHDDKGNRWAMKRIRLNNFRDFLQVRFEAETMRVMSQASNNVVKYVDDNLQEVSAAFRRSGTPHDSDKTYEVFILTDFYPSRCSSMHFLFEGRQVCFIIKMQFVLFGLARPTGNVLQLINERLQDRRMLRESEVLQIFCDVCAAVGQMHNKQPPIIHRDLKIENILISATGRYILCDFGSATNRILDPAKDSVNVIREELERYTTIAYRAPEMVNLYNMKTISTKADIWALGVLLYKLCFFNDPFGSSHLAIENAKYFIPAQHHYRPQVITLIKLCLNPEPSQRPDVYQLAEAACEMSQRRCTVPNTNNSAALDLDALAHTILNAESAAAAASPSTSRDVHADAAVVGANQTAAKQTNSTSEIIRGNSAAVARGSVTMLSAAAAQPVEITTSVAPRERPRAIGRSGKISSGANFTLLGFSNSAAAVSASSSPSSSIAVAGGISNSALSFAEPTTSAPLLPPVIYGDDSTNDAGADNDTTIHTEFETEEDLLQLSDPNAASSPPSSIILISGGGSGASNNVANNAVNNAALTAEFESYFNNPSYPDPFSDNCQVPMLTNKADDEEEEVDLINISSSPPPPLTPSIQRHIEQQYQFNLPSSNAFAPQSSPVTAPASSSAVGSDVSAGEKIFMPMLPHQHRNSLSLKKKPSTAAAIRARAVTAQENTAAQQQNMTSAPDVVEKPTVHKSITHLNASEPKKPAVPPNRPQLQQINRASPTHRSPAVFSANINLQQPQKGALSYERLDHDDDFSDDDAGSLHAAQRSAAKSGKAAASLSSLSSSTSSLTATAATLTPKQPTPTLGFLQHNGMAMERSIVTNRKLTPRASTNDYSADGGEKYTPSSPELSSSSNSSSSDGSSVANSSSGGDADGDRAKISKKSRKSKKKAVEAAKEGRNKLLGANSADADHSRLLSGGSGHSIARIDPPPSSSGLRRGHLQHLTASGGGLGHQQPSMSPNIVNSSTTASGPLSSSRDAVRQQNSLFSTSSKTLVTSQNMPTKTAMSDPFSNAPGFAAVFDRHSSGSVPPGVQLQRQPPRIAAVFDASPSNVGSSRPSTSARASTVSYNPFAAAAGGAGIAAAPQYVHSTPLVIRRSAVQPDSNATLKASAARSAATTTEFPRSGAINRKTPEFSLVSADSDVLSDSDKQHQQNISSAIAATRVHKRGDSSGSVSLTGNNNKYAVASTASPEGLSPR